MDTLIFRRQISVFVGKSETYFSHKSRCHYCHTCRPIIMRIEREYQLFMQALLAQHLSIWNNFYIENIESKQNENPIHCFQRQVCELLHLPHNKSQKLFFYAHASHLSRLCKHFEENSAF